MRREREGIGNGKSGGGVGGRFRWPIGHTLGEFSAVIVASAAQACLEAGPAHGAGGSGGKGLACELVGVRRRGWVAYEKGRGRGRAYRPRGMRFAIPAGPYRYTSISRY